MSNVTRRVVAGLLTLMVTAGIGWLARAEYQSPQSNSATLRLSWRSRAGAQKTCRPRTPAELDALPVHMRTPEVCESTGAAYLLIVGVDQNTPDTTSIVPGGMKADRPLYVMRDVALEPGSHRVRLSFVSTGFREGAVAIDTVVSMRAGSITLVTLHDDGDRFVIR